MTGPFIFNAALTVLFGLGKTVNLHPALKPMLPDAIVNAFPIPFGAWVLLVVHSVAILFIVTPFVLRGLKRIGHALRAEV